MISIKMVITKKNLKGRINGGTQERYKRIKFRNKEKCFLEEIVF